MKIDIESLKKAILFVINEENEQRFKAGMTVPPHFESWEDFEAFNEIINYKPEPLEILFKDFLNDGVVNQ